MLFHELTHSIEGTDQYRQIQDILISLQYGTTYDQMMRDREAGLMTKADQRLLAALQMKGNLYNSRGVQLDEAGALYEVTADLTYKMFNGDAKAINDFVKADPNLAQRILAKIKEFIQTLTGTAPDQTQSEMQKRLTKAQELFEQALRNRETQVSEARSIDEYMVDQATIDELQRKYSLRDVQHDADTIRTNMKNVVKMDPLSIDTPIYQIGDQALRDKLFDMVDKLGNTVDSDVFGGVILNHRSIREDIAHGMTPLKVALVQSVPDVIRHGGLVDYQDNWKGKPYDTAVLAAPIKIVNGPLKGEYFVGTVINLYGDEHNRFYTHDGHSAIIKKGTNVVQTAVANVSKGGGHGNADPLVSILKQIAGVKTVMGLEGDYKKAVDSGDISTAQKMVEQAAEALMPNSKMRTEDGKLRKFYHGTNSDSFTVFDPKYIGTAREGDTGFFGRGFYFAYSEGEARAYGRNVKEVFLDIKNPFNFQQELNTIDGQRTSDYNGSRAVFITKFAEKFPELAGNHKVNLCEKGSDTVKEISLAEFAKRFRYVYNTVEFNVEPIEGEYGTEWLVTADPHTETFTGSDGTEHSWTEYGYQRRYLTEQDARNRLSNVYEYMANTMYSYLSLPSQTDIIQETDFSNAVQARGYDGIIQSEDGDEAVIFKSSQAKLADPVTYDDNGKPIDLSQRFNRQNDDIRYSLDEGAPPVDNSDLMQQIREEARREIRERMEQERRELGADERRAANMARNNVDLYERRRNGRPTLQDAKSSIIKNPASRVPAGFLFWWR